LDHVPIRPSNDHHGIRIRNKIREGRRRGAGYGSDNDVIYDDSSSLTPKRSYERGQQINAKVIEFIKAGAIVSIDDNDAKGLISNIEIEYFIKKNNINGSDFRIGNVVVGYVNRIREDDGKIDVGLRLPSLERNKAAEKAILDLLLKADNGSIAVGDKSTVESIGLLLPGMSKLTFKTVVGNLYKENKVEPGPFEIKLINSNKQPLQKSKQQQQQQQQQQQRALRQKNQ